MRWLLTDFSQEPSKWRKKEKVRNSKRRPDWKVWDVELKVERGQLPVNLSVVFLVYKVPNNPRGWFTSINSYFQKKNEKGIQHAMGRWCVQEGRKRKWFYKTIMTIGCGSFHFSHPTLATSPNCHPSAIENADEPVKQRGSVFLSHLDTRFQQSLVIVLKVFFPRFLLLLLQIIWRWFSSDHPKVPVV